MTIYIVGIVKMTPSNLNLNANGRKIARFVNVAKRVAFEIFLISLKPFKMAKNKLFTIRIGIEATAKK